MKHRTNVIHESKAADFICPFSLSRNAFLTCYGEECMAWQYLLDEYGNIVYRNTEEEWSCKECKGAGCEKCEGEGHGYVAGMVGFCSLTFDQNISLPFQKRRVV